MKSLFFGLFKRRSARSQPKKVVPRYLLEVTKTKAVIKGAILKLTLANGKTKHVRLEEKTHTHKSVVDLVSGTNRDYALVSQLVKLAAGFTPEESGFDHNFYQERFFVTKNSFEPLDRTLAQLMGGYTFGDSGGMYELTDLQEMPFAIRSEDVRAIKVEKFYDVEKIELIDSILKKIKE